jgi:hypothetical protein
MKDLFAAATLALIVGLLPVSTCVASEKYKCKKSDKICSSLLYHMGVKNPKEVKTFLEILKRAIKSDDRELIGSLIKYPFVVYNLGKTIKSYSNKSELLNDFNIIFTDKVKMAILNASYQSLFINYQGAMIGNGEIWFYRWESEALAGGKILIKAINN